MVSAAAAAKSLQSCLTLYDPIDGSPPGSPVPGTQLQYSCLENPMGGGAWYAAVHGVAKSRTKNVGAGCHFTPGDIPDLRIKTASSALAGGFFTTVPHRTE